MKLISQTQKGFTLIEMLLVLVVASGMMVMFITYTQQKAGQFRRDKTALQIQEVLNAGMTYYVANGFWPHQPSHTDYFVFQSELVTKNYLPSPFRADPYVNAVSDYGNNNYLLSDDTKTFKVFAPVPTLLEAQIIAGMVPGGFVRTSGANIFYAAGQVSIPGQNLNNARSVNFANIYSSGGCVPAPVCPATMVPQILLTPVSVSGVYETPTCSSSSDPTTCTNVITYPVSSFTAYAKGTGANNLPIAPGSGNPTNCDGSGGSACSLPGSAPLDPATTKYWRACLGVFTSKGKVAPSANSNQGRLMGNILAITRCAPANSTGTITESPTGSPISVYSN
jgi:prepilin-type N-terminal cleavage/methylation domain-containing protein